MVVKYNIIGDSIVVLLDSSDKQICRLSKLLGGDEVIDINKIIN